MEKSNLEAVLLMKKKSIDDSVLKLFSLSLTLQRKINCYLSLKGFYDSLKFVEFAVRTGGHTMWYFLTYIRLD